MFEQPDQTKVNRALMDAESSDSRSDGTLSSRQLLVAEIRWLRQQAPTQPMRLLFQGRPGRTQHQFVAVRRPRKHLVELSTWTERDDGLWELTIPVEQP